MAGSIVALSVCGLAAAGGLYARSLGQLGGRWASTDAVAEAKSRFVAGRAPARVVDVAGAFAMRGRGALLNPASSLPSSHRHDLGQLKALYDYARSCDGFAPAVGRDLAKAAMWHGYRCRARPSLPPDFFTQAPYMHPSGRSYVALAVRSRSLEFADAAWIEEHVRFAHVVEIAGLVPAGVALDPEIAIVAGLEQASLRALSDGDDTVLTTQHILFVERPAARLAEGPRPPPRYLAYSLDQWAPFASSAALSVGPKVRGQRCLLSEGQVCWRLDPGYLRRAGLAYGLLAAFSFLALAATAGFLLVSRVRAQRRERDDRAFILRTLTHELRTPAAALNLALEPLRNEFDELPDASQGAFLRMCDEVQRLNRVIAGSSRYLRSHEGADVGRFRPLRIDSLRGFLSDRLSGDRAAVELELCPDDTGFSTDPHWLGVVVENLVDNALAHGRPPARLRVRVEGGVMRLRVEDSGRMPCVSLRELTASFQRADDSRGLGLGLSVCAEITRSDS